MTTMRAYFNSDASETTRIACEGLGGKVVLLSEGRFFLVAEEDLDADADGDHDAWWSDCAELVEDAEMIAKIRASEAP